MSQRIKGRSKSKCQRKIAKLEAELASTIALLERVTKDRQYFVEKLKQKENEAPYPNSAALAMEVSKMTNQVRMHDEVVYGFRFSPECMLRFTMGQPSGMLFHEVNRAIIPILDEFKKAVIAKTCELLGVKA